MNEMYMKANWGSADINANLGGVIHSFSNDAVREALDYVKRNKFSDVDPYKIQDIEIDLDAIPTFCHEVRSRMSQLDNGSKFTVFAGIPDATKEEGRIIYWALSRSLGNQLVQHTNGDRISFIFDRGGKRMTDGGRYHQGNEGGQPHTDNVNYNEEYDYLALLSDTNAFIGGGNGIVSGHRVYETLKYADPRFIETLQGEFWWESRGVNEEDSTFQAPILKMEGDVPKWRFLETYLRSASQRENAPFTEDGENAIEALKAAIYDPNNCLSIHLAEGQTLVFNDSEFFHMRVGVFKDREKSLQEYDFGICKNRLRLRTLIRANRGK